MWFCRATPPQAVLLKAADLLETDGWIQGALEIDGKHCAAGAIAAIAKGSAVVSGDAIDLMRAEVGWITIWNDQSDQTAENVIKTMRKAARR